jgi:diguanylate cyclase (GGDEF)-like protein/PAS domain S-box-containing protein
MSAKSVTSPNAGSEPRTLRDPDDWHGEGSSSLTVLDAGVEEVYHSLVENLAEMVFRKDLAGRFVYANQRFCDWIGRTRQEVLGKTDFELFPAEIAERMATDDRHAVDSGASAANAEIYLFPERKPEQVHLRRLPIRDARGRVVGLHGILSQPAAAPPPAPDAAAAALEEQAFHLATLFEDIPDTIYFKDGAGRYTRISRQMAVRFGIQDPAQAVGKTDFDFFPADQAARSFQDEQQILATGTPLVNVEEKEVLSEGGVKWLSTTKMPLRDPRGKIIGTFGISRDITQHKRMEEAIARHGFYDALTNLPNRALFLNRIEHMFRRAVRQADRGLPYAILYLDVDRFKGVNDSFGHAAGDELLVAIARRLERCLRPSDTLARLGGDDFAILLEDLRSGTDATRVAERIHRNMVEPFDVSGNEVYCSTSIGIALSTSGYARAHEMLRDANTAMYRAKANGRSRHEIFDADMHRRAVSQLKIETDLRRAIERREFVVYYQPIVDLQTRLLTGFESLVRWKHPKQGLVPPGEFIPVAEETGLIVPIGQWVMQESCRQITEWQARHPGDAPLRISVNLSSHQIAQPDLVDQIRQTLESTGMDPRQLAVEITESALVRDMSAGAAVLERLRELKISLNIDDFGTGYSSLAYLQNLPVDALKIDRSFVSRIKAVGGRLEIVQAIITLAHSLGMKVVAEGVETKEQLDALTSLRCNAAQGYLFARPLPAEDAEQLLTRGLAPF